MYEQLNNITENAENPMKSRQKLKIFNIMEATLFQSNKSVKILVLNGKKDPLFKLEANVFGEQLKNDITFVGSFSGVENDLISAIKPDVIINLKEPDKLKDSNTPNISLKVFSERVIPYIINVDVKLLQKYYEIFLLIDQVKQIKSQLKLD